MQLSSTGFPLLAVLLAALFWSGCESAPPAPPTVMGGYTAPPLNTVPADFLATDFAALQKWLDERFEVEYRNMTPAMVFEQEPIADIKYDLVNIPAEAPLFHLKSSNLSRREILHKIATFWSFDMSIVNDANGVPSIVRVAPR
ncbi:MAG: hypothetical protein JNK37_09460 [Verrucomicrobiales bacterium]|nr:hypothetical protein [Verrucomicrobiales bacterium]